MHAQEDSVTMLRSGRQPENAMLRIDNVHSSHHSCNEKGGKPYQAISIFYNFAFRVFASFFSSLIDSLVFLACCLDQFENLAKCETLGTCAL